MKPLLKSNIIKSLDLLEKMNFCLPTDLIKKKGNIKDSVIDIFFPKIAILNPCFYRKTNNEIASIQEDYFGVYALKKIIAHTFISIPFLKAALEPESIPMTPSIVLNYTGCFHMLIAYLALNGRVLIDNVLGTPYVEIPNHDNSQQNPKITPAGSGGHEILENCPDFIMAILTKSNKWKFEGRTRSHKTIWRELKPIFLELKKIPDEFLNILNYLTSYGPYQEEDEKKIIEDGLERIADTRHMASYVGIGEDDYAVDRLMDGDLWINPDAIKRKLFTYSDFSKKLLNTVSLDLFNIINSINDPKYRKREFIFFMLSSPPVGITLYPNWENSSVLNDRLKNISGWIWEHLRDKIPHPK